MNSLRTEKLRAFIKSPDTAVLIKNEINVGYFSGFHHSEGVFLLTSDKAYLLVDFRYFEAAQKFAVGCEVICFKKLIADISEILKKNVSQKSLQRQIHLPLRKMICTKSILPKKELNFTVTVRLIRLFQTSELLKINRSLTKF